MNCNNKINELKVRNLCVGGGILTLIHHKYSKLYTKLFKSELYKNVHILFVYNL